MATLNARVRSDKGKGVARKLRQAGEVPAVVYGHGQEGRSLSVNTHELETLLTRINPENTIIDLKVDGGKPLQALIREVQHHPSRPSILHVDFFEIRANETLQVAVPVVLTGTAVGVSEGGGMLQEILRELQVETLPADIPSSIELDVSSLEVGQSLHVSDVMLSVGTVLNDPELVVCTVSAPTVAALPEDTEAEGGVGGDVEPELVGRGDAEGEGPGQPE